MKKWKELTTTEQWADVFESSAKRPVFVFKHSSTCPISAEALRHFENYLKEQPREDVDYVFVKVIESRPVSNQIAEDVQVKHESPQAIFIDHKKAVWHASHWKITNKAIDEALKA